MVHLTLTPHTQRISSFFAACCAFSAACILFYQNVVYYDFALFDVASLAACLLLTVRYYPPGALTRGQIATVFLVSLPFLLAEEVHGPLSDTSRYEVVLPSNRPVYRQVQPTRIWSLGTTFVVITGTLPFLTEYFFRANQRRNRNGAYADRQVELVQVADGKRTPKTTATEEVEAAPAPPSQDTALHGSRRDESVEGIDERYGPWEASTVTISLKAMLVQSVLQYVVTGVLRGYVLSSGLAAAVNLALVFIQIALVSWEAHKGNVRRARGHLIGLYIVLMGVFLLTRIVTLIQQETDPGLASFFVFLLVLFALFMGQLYFWRSAILITNVWEALPLVYPMQTVDDLMSDFLVSTNLAYDLSTFLMFIALLARLILRDVGYFEDGYNWLRAKMFGDVHEARAQSFGSEKLAQEYRLYRKVLHARKYWLYASQDLLSEHLSAVVLPTLMLVDFYGGGWCIVSCQIKSEEVLWTAVSIFGVLLVLKLVANEIVWRLSKRNMEQVEVEVKLFEAEHGMLPAESPLRMWSDYDVDQTLPLVEQCDVVSKLHIKRHYWFFLACTFTAILASISAGGQLDF